MTLEQVATLLGVSKQAVWTYYRDNVKGFRDCCSQIDKNRKITVHKDKFERWLSRLEL